MPMRPQYQPTQVGARLGVGAGMPAQQPAVRPAAFGGQPGGSFGSPNGWASPGTGGFVGPGGGSSFGSGGLGCGGGPSQPGGMGCGGMTGPSSQVGGTQQQGSIGSMLNGTMGGTGTQAMGKNPGGGFVQKNAGNQDGSFGGGGGGGCCGGQPQMPGQGDPAAGLLGRNMQNGQGMGMYQPSVMPGSNPVDPSGPGFQAGGFDQQQSGYQAPQTMPGHGAGSGQPQTIPGQAGGGAHPWSPGAGAAASPNNGWSQPGPVIGQARTGLQAAPQGVGGAMNPANFAGSNVSGNSNDQLYNAIATGNQGGLAGAGSGATNSAINAAAGGGGGGNSAGYLDWYRQNQTRLNRQGPMYQPGGMFYNPAIDGAQNG